ncbi:MAG: hypothetical protein ACI4D7_01140 [Lachnospiraceae bacterium]
MGDITGSKHIFTSDHYDEAKKVCSIWICKDTPQQNTSHKDVSDTITEYFMEPKVICQSDPDREVAIGRYDLLSVVFVCLRDDSTVHSKNRLIGMLSTLLSSKMQVPEKKEELEGRYDLPMSVEMERECAIMCNLSHAIAEEARAEERKAIIKENEAIIKEKDAIIKAKDEEIRTLKEELAQFQKNK